LKIVYKEKKYFFYKQFCKNELKLIRFYSMSIRATKQIIHAPNGTVLGARGCVEKRAYKE